MYVYNVYIIAYMHRNASCTWIQATMLQCVCVCLCVCVCVSVRACVHVCVKRRLSDKGPTSSTEEFSKPAYSTLVVKDGTTLQSDEDKLHELLG